MIHSRLDLLRHAALLISTIVCCTAGAQESITSPLQQFGNNLGDDYFLANYQQLTEYWKKLEQESPRMKLRSIGKTEEGRDILMAIVTSPENHARLAEYKEISRRLATAKGLDEKSARELSTSGKAVVWIDGGLHASEVLVAQQLMETLYRFVSQDDTETMRILDDVIILFCNPNPDGQDLVADWYMRHEDPKKRRSRGLPRLYQKYIGHDNNRDFYMITQKETEALCRIFYHEWFPQIIFNHHQTGPSGTVLFAPPFRDPFNHNYDPLVPIGIDLVGAAIHQRFLVEGKPGATMRSGASYSTWWNGGLRTNTYFHNMIGLLTETIGHPTPMTIPLRLDRQVPHGDLPMPVEPQTWHFRQSVEYSVTSNRAVLDLASRHREQFLFNIWRMGMNSIERGSQDTWTNRPHRVDAAKKRLADARANNEKRPDVFREILRNPDLRDPRGYIIPANQWDSPTATVFVQTLIKGGIDVERATKSFEVNGKSYDAGSFVVRCAQAFRPHIIDMFEPQDHPDDIPYPGGAPIPPYDAAGWTLAYQMGVAFDRVLEAFDAPTEPVVGLPEPLAGSVTKSQGARGFFLSAKTNAAFTAVNRLLRAGRKVSRLKKAMRVGQVNWPIGTWFVHGSPDGLDKVTTLGVDLIGTNRRLSSSSLSPVRRPRIALWDRHGGSMPSGWIRWLLERFEFEFEVVFPQELDAGKLNEKYDAIVFPPGAIPQSGRSGGSSRGRGGRRSRGMDPARIPGEFRHQLGSISINTTIPQLKSFLEKGGSIVTIGSSTSLAKHLGLPIENALTVTEQGGKTRPLKREEFFIPGSVVQVHVDTSQVAAYGAQESTDVMFRRSPAFRLPTGDKSIRPIAWFDSVTPLRSGWAWGQERLQHAVAMAQADVGRGKLYLFGPDVTYRAQPHGSFRFVFNALY